MIIRFPELVNTEKNKITKKIFIVKSTFTIVEQSGIIEI